MRRTTPTRIMSLLIAIAALVAGSIAVTSAADAAPKVKTERPEALQKDKGKAAGVRPGGPKAVSTVQEATTTLGRLSTSDVAARLAVTDGQGVVFVPQETGHESLLSVPMTDFGAGFELQVTWTAGTSNEPTTPWEFAAFDASSGEWVTLEAATETPAGELVEVTATGGSLSPYIDADGIVTLRISTKADTAALFVDQLGVSAG